MVGFCHGGNMPASHYYHHYYYHYHHYYYIIIIISQYHHDLSNLIKIPPPVLNHMLVQLLIKLGHRLQIGKLFNRLETRISFFYKYLNAGVILGYPTHTHIVSRMMFAPFWSRAPAELGPMGPEGEPSDG